MLWKIKKLSYKTGKFQLSNINLKYHAIQNYRKE